MALQPATAELRLRAVQQILSAMEVEKSAHPYEMGRNQEQYESYFFGLDQFLETIEETDALPKEVVEVGVGKGVAFARIASTHPSLHFVGTVLNKEIVTAEVPENADLQVAAVEGLQDIKDESIGGLYGLYSVSYSEPKLAIKRINQVLAPGGVVKLVLHEAATSSGASGYTTFLTHLQDLGYDYHVYITSNMDALSKFAPKEKTPHVILTAVKPTTVQDHTTARQLFELDRDAYLEEKIGKFQFTVQRLKRYFGLRA